MEIKSFKMRTGEEITCEIVQRNGDTGEIKVKNPVMIVQVPEVDQEGKPTGRQSPQMVGYFQTSCGEERTGNETTDRLFTLTNEIYFIEGETMTYIKDSYNQQFGAGIVIPDQKIVSAG